MTLLNIKKATICIHSLAKWSVLQIYKDRTAALKVSLYQNNGMLHNGEWEESLWVTDERWFDIIIRVTSLSSMQLMAFQHWRRKKL